MSNIAWPDLVTVVSTTKDYKLGTERTETAAEVIGADSTHSGPRTWVYVYNDEASTAFAKGDVIVRDASTTPAGPFDGVRNADVTPTIGVLGVAQHAIAAGSYGWIVCKGVCEVKCCDTGTDQKGAALVTAASGDASSEGVDVRAGASEDHMVIGYGLDAGGGVAGNLITAVIRL